MCGMSDNPVHPHFDPASLDDLDEPVRRYLRHALAPGTPLRRGVHLEMGGHIKVGAWLRFRSVWEGDGRSFSWRATAGPGPLPLLRVHDQFSAGRGFMDIRLRSGLRRLPALKLLHAQGDDVARSGAGRAALEALWVPMALLPDRGVGWRADSHDLIVASREVPPERPEVHIRIGPDGLVRSYSALRWRGGKQGYVPFGVDVLAETRFGPLTIPGRLTAGWGHGTADWSPFFRAEVTAADLLD
jgi:hypothetical protein